jgi:hypothetical protein
MQTEKKVFEKLFASDKVELESQRIELSIIDDLRKEITQKGVFDSDSALLATLRNKSKTALVDLGTFSNKLKPIQDAVITLNDDALKRQLAALDVAIQGAFKKHKKLESILSEAIKA